MTKETVTPENHCPYCGKKFDRCSSVTEDVTPRPGDFTVCIRCSCLMAFTGTLRVRPLTIKELELLTGDANLRQAVEKTVSAVRSVNRRMSQN